MPLFLGVTLTALAGWIDAIGFLRLGGYYTSFMSGNTTQLGVALVDAAPDGPLLPVLLVALFFGGAMLGGILGVVAGRWTLPIMLCVVGALLWSSAAVLLTGYERDATVLLAAAMGLQNAAPLQVGAARPGVTYVTGTLFNAGRGLALALAGKLPHREWLLHLLIWSSLMIGALGGAAAYHRIGPIALVGPAVLVSFLAVVSLATLGMRAIKEP